jgi:ketosteroid isomerase-like protein
MRILLLLVVWAITACTSSISNEEKRNIAHVRSMFDAFNRHDWKAMSEHYADSALFLDPALGLEYAHQSRNETADKYAAMEVIFPDIKDEVITIFGKGDKVAIEFISSGTSGDSIKFKLPISCVLTLDKNLIVRDATYYNNCE